MKDEKKIFEEYLRDNDLKLTMTRQIILSTVFSLHAHFDVDELYDIIKETAHKVSRATIYRTIPLLVDAGLVKAAVRSDGKERYEHVFGHDKHLHMICEVCGKIHEASTKEFERLIKKMAKAHNFHVEDFSIGIRGKCDDCC